MCRRRPVCLANDPASGVAMTVETVSDGLVADEAANVACLLVNGVASVGRGLDPVDELGEPPVRPTLHRRCARLSRKYLIHRTYSPIRSRRPLIV